MMTSSKPESDAPRPPPEASSGDWMRLDNSPLGAGARKISPGKPAQPQLPAIPGYELLGEMCRSESGIVVKARHLQTNRLAAIRLMPKSRFAEPAEFRNAARALIELRIPHVVQVDEIGD